MIPPDYSLWLLPAPGPALNRLREVASKLRAAVPGAAPLDPHLTLLPSLGHDRRRAIGRARVVAAAIATHRRLIRGVAHVPGVATGNHRYQSVMADIARAPWLMALHRLVGATQPAPARTYRPHLSLLYADLDPTRITALASAVRHLPPRIPLGRLAVCRVCTGIERRYVIWSWPLPGPGHALVPIP